jgi:hypothetical protein
MSLEELRAVALSLPEAHEAPHFERTSFRVGTRIFATAATGGDQAMVVVKPPERLDALLASYPESFFHLGTWTTRNGSLGVRLAHVEAALVRTLIIDSWSRIAPHHARAAFDAAEVTARRR